MSKHDRKIQARVVGVFAWIELQWDDGFESVNGKLFAMNSKPSA